ncbi:hypothetical protein [Dyella acidiphila]|uniref:Uncharacterized protein n=1 Tax=Dyella acidiphila TaxID=2775866 RepID=A0ABR9GCD9_9GAMM|nr:hypothetical protein [Dyella acidiphila]MBE1161726.1 hypothetical protein [Dyella acidiphila]
MRHKWSMLGVLVVSPLAIAASAGYVDFINGSGDPVVAISLAKPGSGDWKPVKLHGVVHGGYVSLDGGYMGEATVAMDISHGCFYDVLVEFSQRRALLLNNVDACRTHRIDIDRAWQQTHSIS